MPPEMAERILAQWVDRIIDDGIEWGILRGFHRLTLTIDDPFQKQTLEIVGTVNDQLDSKTTIRITGEES